MAQAAYTCTLLWICSFFYLSVLARRIQDIPTVPTNITIGNNRKDPLTGAEITYAGNWVLDGSCGTCEGFINSWHASISHPDASPPTASVQFKGIAVFVHFVIAPSDTQSHSQFFIDGQLQKDLVLGFPSAFAVPKPQAVFSATGLTNENHTLLIQNGLEDVPSLVLLHNIVYTVDGTTTDTTVQPVTLSITSTTSSPSKIPTTSSTNSPTASHAPPPTHPQQPASGSATFSRTSSRTIAESSSFPPSNVSSPTAALAQTTPSSHHIAVILAVVSVLVLGLATVLFLFHRMQARRRGRRNSRRIFLVWLRRPWGGPLLHDTMSSGGPQVAQRREEIDLGSEAHSLRSISSASNLSHLPRTPPPAFHRLTPPPPSYLERSGHKSEGDVAGDIGGDGGALGL